MQASRVARDAKEVVYLVCVCIHNVDRLSHVRGAVDSLRFFLLGTAGTLGTCWSSVRIACVPACTCAAQQAPHTHTLIQHSPVPPASLSSRGDAANTFAWMNEPERLEHLAPRH